MCIRDSAWVFESAGLKPGYLIGGIPGNLGQGARFTDSDWFIIEGDEYDTAFFDKRSKFCLLYTSDAADERSSVDLGGRRTIKKKKN